MHDLAFVAFVFTIIGLGFRKPFIFVLSYIYVDIVSPQRLSYFLLNSLPLSLIVAALSVLGWLVADDKRDIRIAPRQWLMLAILGWAGWTTFYADFPLEALGKWSWVWKGIFFSFFLPFTLRTRLRIEALIFFMLISASSIIIVGGIKTLVSGGGYGALNLMITDNTGLYEGSIISAVAIGIIPLILWSGKYGTIFPADWRRKTFVVSLVFACLLIPVGTQARTGLVCIGVLAMLQLRDARRRLLYLTLMIAVGLAAIPLLPKTYVDRMHTIKEHKADESASTRVAVWGWTWQYVLKHPMGGGFEMYRQNELHYETVKTEGSGGSEAVETRQVNDKARAFHSSYFEMLGEQGFPGLAMWLALHLGGLLRMEVLRRRFRNRTGDEAWVAPLATALQHAQLLILIGSAFVGIAFLPFIWMLLSVQIGLDGYLARRAQEAARLAFKESLKPRSRDLAGGDRPPMGAGSPQPALK